MNRLDSQPDSFLGDERRPCGLVSLTNWLPTTRDWALESSSRSVEADLPPGRGSHKTDARTCTHPCSVASSSFNYQSAECSPKASFGQSASVTVNKDAEDDMSLIPCLLHEPLHTGLAEQSSGGCAHLSEPDLGTMQQNKSL